MICPYCQEEEEKSRVTPVGGSSTMVYGRRFYDEDGKFHDHKALDRRKP